LNAKGIAMLFRTPELNEQDRAVIAQVDDVKQSLRYAVGSTQSRWQGLLRRSTFARNIQGSNSIEGYNVTIDDAIAAAVGEEPLEADAESWAAVRGYRSAMTYVVQLADDRYFGFSTDLLRSLHYMMMEHDLSKHPGKWRAGPIYVRNEANGEVVYEGPDAGMVAPLMVDLVTALNEPDEYPGIVRAAMAHLNLVMIHPFSDGNGRMGRCLQTLVLARSGTLHPVFSSIEEYLGRNTAEYYSVLAKVGEGSWHPDNDARPWMRFCLTAHFQQATTLLRRTQATNQLLDEIESIAQRMGLLNRVVFAVADAAMGFRVRNATYRSIAGVSEGIASRDLKTLVDSQLLIAHGERRNRYYTASDQMLALYRKIRGERRPIDDPYKSDQLTLPGLGGRIGARR
jgi:Fic family protein